MEASFLARILGGEEIRIICWTLIHSIWIGVVFAAIAGLVLVATQKSASPLRYRLLCFCLFAFVLINGLVFYLESQSRTGFPDVSGHVYPRTLTELPRITALNPEPENPAILTRLIGFIDRHSASIFAVWFMFFVFKSIRMFGGVLYIYRIRTRQVHAVGEDWEERLRKLSENLGVTKTIGLLQSEIVKVPVTVGYFKPLILIPVGMVLQLPYEQVETILVHELAHIHRKDYLVNLLQSLLETVFFFNPGVLWLSALIREEREICCDDIVLANTSGKSNYLEALLAFHHYDNEPNKLTMALSLRGNQLVNRLKRIINQENKRISIMEKIVLFAGMLGISAFCYLSASPQNQEKRELPVKSERVVSRQVKLNTETVTEKSASVIIAPTDVKREKTHPIDVVEKIESASEADTVYRFKSIRFEQSNQDLSNRDMMVTDDKNNVYELKVVDSKLTGVKINGVDVPEGELGHYQDLLAQVDKTWNNARESKQRLIAEERSKSDRERRLYRENFKKAQKGKDFKKETGFKRKEEGFKREHDFKKEARLAKKDDGLEKKEAGFAKEAKRKPGKEAKQWRKEEKEDRVGRKKELMSKRLEKGDKKHIAGIKRMPEPHDISADQARVKGIIEALVDHQVIKNKSSLEWFGLSENELIVNGEKQSAELQQKLKQAYNITEGHGLYYGPVKMTGKGVFLDTGDL